MKCDLPGCLLVGAVVVGASSPVVSLVLLEALEAMEGELELMYFVAVMHAVEEVFGEVGATVPV